jgi:hypothetical protein
MVHMVVKMMTPKINTGLTCPEVFTPEWRVASASTIRTTVGESNAKPAILRQGTDEAEGDDMDNSFDDEGKQRPIRYYAVLSLPFVNTTGRKQKAYMWETAECVVHNQVSTTGYTSPSKRRAAIR